MDDNLTARPARLSTEEFDVLFRDVDNGQRWPHAPGRGALNHVTAERVAAAGREISLGRSVSLAHPLDTQVSADNPAPAEHRMTVVPDPHAASAEFACDFVGVEMHGEAHSHLDALCHVAYRGSLFGGIAAGAVTEHGAAALSVEGVATGIAGRGVLLDIPRLRGVPWLEPGEAIDAGELERAERAQGVQIGPGDILLVRTGHTRRRMERGPWDAAEARAGLDPRAMRLLHARGIAALGSDGDGDCLPSPVDGVSHPIHVLGITAIGLHFFDALNLEDLAAECEQHGRWAFFFVAAPLRIAGGTGSPVNPLAFF